MSELKPCPFCGRTPIVDDCGDNRYFVKCKCGIVQDKLYAQKCDAVRRWNTRKTGKIAKDTNVPSNDCISRQAAINALYGEIEITGKANAEAVKGYGRLVKDRIERLPSVQPEIIRCRDCKRWYPDADTGMACEYTNMGAPPVGYCNWAERREDG